jgi:AcrR family transcriptional regulator
MSIRESSLAQRQSEFTRRTIVGTAVDLLTEAPLSELSARAIAARAGMSERTVFRYFNTREILLNEIAEEILARLEVPDLPQDVGGLIDYPARLFGQFEQHQALTRAILNSQLYDRVRKLVRERRGSAIAGIIDACAPQVAASIRRRATANLEYHLTASAWHYFRFHFDFSPRETIACTRMAIADTLRGLGVGVAQA